MKNIYPGIGYLAVFLAIFFLVIIVGNVLWDWIDGVIANHLQKSDSKIDNQSIEEEGGRSQIRFYVIVFIAGFISGSVTPAISVTKLGKKYINFML